MVVVEKSMTFNNPIWVDRFLSLVQHDGEAQQALKHVSFSSLLQTGDERALLVVRAGGAEIRPNPSTDDVWDFTVKADAAVWEQFISGAVTPQFNTPFSMALQGVMNVAGDVKNHFSFEGNNHAIFANMFPLIVLLLLMRRMEA